MTIDMPLMLPFKLTMALQLHAVVGLIVGSCRSFVLLIVSHFFLLPLYWITDHVALQGNENGNGNDSIKQRQRPADHGLLPLTHAAAHRSFGAVAH
jgi:hypothetical protein